MAADRIHQTVAVRSKPAVAWLLVVLAALCCIFPVAAEASSPNGNSNNPSYSSGAPSSSSSSSDPEFFTFIDLTSDDDNDSEHHHDHHHHHEGNGSDDDTDVAFSSSSFSLVEGGDGAGTVSTSCFVSAQSVTLYNRGGSGDNVRSYFYQRRQHRESDDDESDSDDDDDDDDDGHSSMLSNASLRRSSTSRHVVYAGGGGGGGGGDDSGYDNVAADNSGGDSSRQHSDHKQQQYASTSRKHSDAIDFLFPTSSTWFPSSLLPFARLRQRRRRSNLPLLALRGGGGAKGGPVAATKSAAAVTMRTKRKSGGEDTHGKLYTAVHSEVFKHLLVTALVTLIFEGVIGHILEFLKIVMQTAPPDTSYASVIQDITSEKGLAGLWDGFCPWGIVQAVSKGAVFGIAFALTKSLLLPLAQKGLIPYQLAYTLAGGVGGGFQGYVLSPTLLLKTRVMTNEVFREKTSMLRTTWLSLKIGVDIVATEGLLALMKGSNVFATKRVFDWASRYFFSDLFESTLLRLKKKKGEKSGQPLTVAEKSLCSLLGGVASTCVTLPLDVLVAKTQDAKKAGIKVSPIQMFFDEVKERGWAGQRRAYMQGFEARLAHVCLTTVVVKTGVPIAYNIMFPSKS